jgi:molybdenum cofactor synthesis domain-containing protein
MVIQVGIMTLSDRASSGEYEDRSGPLIREMIETHLPGAQIRQQAVVPDDLATIKDELVRWCDQERVDLLLTTGGTGFTPRDVTPEATRAVIERKAPGLAEAMRAASLRVTPYAMLSRAVAGMRGRTLIVNLPGSPKAVKENLEVILPALPHAIALLKEGGGKEAEHSYKKKILGIGD